MQIAEKKRRDLAEQRNVELNKQELNGNGGRGVLSRALEGGRKKIARPSK